MKGDLDEIHEDIIFEFANRFGADAVHAYWLLQEIADDDIAAIESILKAEFGIEPTDKLILFCQNFIAGMKCVELANRYLRTAMSVFYSGEEYKTGEAEHDK